jgi:hypothetical protein
MRMIQGSYQQRLQESSFSLQIIEQARQVTRDSNVGRWAERKIIGRELIELEVHEIDSQIARICEGQSTL